MYKKFFNNFLRIPDDDTGTNNGGGGSGNTKSSADGGSQNVDDSDEPELGATSSDDIELYNRFQRGRGGRTARGPEPKGVIQKSLEKTYKEHEEGASEDNAEEEDDTTKEDDTKAPAAKKPAEEKKADESKTDDDDAILNVPLDSLKNKQGVPISDYVKDHIKTLRSSIGKYKTKAEELEKKLQSTEKAPPEELTKLQKENEELRARIDTEHFENSDAFKETYIAPLNAASKDVEKFFPAELDKEQTALLASKFEEAKNAAMKGDEITFYKVVDDISEEFIDGGSALKNAFAAKMGKFHEKLVDYTNAYKDKSEARKQHVEKFTKEMRQKNSGSIEVEIDSYVDKMVTDKAELIDALPEAIRTEYMKNLDEGKKVIKNGLARMALTGETPKEMREILKKGVIADAIVQENRVLATGY
jgi:regulator of replication initiation timing